MDTLSKVVLYLRKYAKVCKNKVQGCSTPLRFILVLHFQLLTMHNDWALQESLSLTLNSLWIVVNANVHCINVFDRYTYVLFECYKLMTWVYMQQRGHLIKITNALIKITMYETSYRYSRPNPTNFCKSKTLGSSVQIFSIFFFFCDL